MSNRIAFGFGSDAQLGDDNETIGGDKADPQKDYRRATSVEELRAALAAGTYRIPSTLVAECLMRSAPLEIVARHEPDRKVPYLGRFSERQAH